MTATEVQNHARLRFTRKQLIRVAKDEIDEWRKLPQGLVLAILFAYVHRLTTGETIEDSFLTDKVTPMDYEI